MLSQSKCLLRFLLWQLSVAAAWVTLVSPQSRRGQTLQATDCPNEIVITSRRGFLVQALVVGTATAAPLTCLADTEGGIAITPATDVTDTPPMEGSVPVSDLPSETDEKIPASESAKIEQYGTESTKEKLAEAKLNDNLKSEEKVEEAVEEVKAEVKELLAELETDEQDEILTEKETEQLITQLEQQLESNETATKTQKEETKNLISQLEKDEEKVEEETLKLIEKVEEVVKAEVDVAETTENEGESLAKAPVEPVVANDFIDQLQARSKSNEEFISELKQDMKNPGKVDKVSFLGELKAREKANKDYLTQFEEFLDRLKVRAPESEYASYGTYMKSERNSANNKFW